MGGSFREGGEDIWAGKDIWVADLWREVRISGVVRIFGCGSFKAGGEDIWRGARLFGLQF